MRFMGFAFMPSGTFASVGIVPMPKQPNAFGLSGLQDDDPANDMTLRSGEVIAQPAAQAEIDRFGESWRVTADENLFRHRPPAPLVPPPAPVVMAELPEETRTAAATTCLQNGVTEINLLRDCTYNVAVTGDPAFADAAAAVQAADATVADLPPTERADGSNPVDDIGQAALAAAQAAVSVNYLMSEHLAAPYPGSLELQRYEGGVSGLIGQDQRIEAGEYAIQLQKDGNLCIHTVEGNRFIWCVSNDPFARIGDTPWVIANTRFVIMSDKGQLVGTTLNGDILYAYPPEPTGIPSDISISPKGEVSLVNKNGIVWSFNSPAPVDTSGQNEPAATDVQTELPETKAEPAVEPAAEAEPDFVAPSIGYGMVGDFHREQRYGALSGHYIVFQADGNLCSYSHADGTLAWCVSDSIKVRYLDTAQIMLTESGQLVALDAAGEVIYAYPPEPPGIPGYPTTLEDGTFALLRHGIGILWSFAPPPRVDNSGQNAPAATDVQTELPEETPEAPSEPAAEPVAGPEPAPETLREGIAVVVTREKRFSLDGYYMIFQADGNLCIYTEADNGFVWCVNNDPSIRYADTAEVVMTTGGQLMGLDAAGEVLYVYPPEPTGMPSDIFISSEGKVTMANETGTIWTFN
ncbi:MAG: hypothetical protein BGP11_01175 [Rhodobacterales bacterium 65-51]|nr:MAG: hypothetical protein BGP11_01175 [Rhodobacterales bacterium 65-51]